MSIKDTEERQYLFWTGVETIGRIRSVGVA